MIDPKFWCGKRVFLTGHTGFKGSWMSLLLSRLGAEVHGFALAPHDDSDLFIVAGVQRDVRHVLGDVRDLSALRKALVKAKPDIVIHMAAQALVRFSYADPVTTYATNVMGTVHLLEAVRGVDSIRAVVIVTSDKCYENIDRATGYREIDRLGGHDPYSNSKGCAELVVASYRNSFFGVEATVRIASGRSGNVIGGGDWARDRLLPDAVRAFISGNTLHIRNPHAIRPWQHVLDPLVAYLLLAERLTDKANDLEGAWNFGPPAESEVFVETVVNAVSRHWGDGAKWEKDLDEHPCEATRLTLDCSKARTRLGWRPMLNLEQAVQLTVEWYLAYHKCADMRTFTLAQIAKTIDGEFGSSVRLDNVPILKMGD